MAEENLKETLDKTLSINIFNVSSAMLGVCLTVIGLFRISKRFDHILSIGDELLAVISVVFLISCFFSYLALKAKAKVYHFRMERIADIFFLMGLTSLVVMCVLIAREFV